MSISREISIQKALKHSLAISQDITEICKPLFDHSLIHTFVYIKFFPDNSRIYLSNNNAWIKHYYNKQYFDNVTHTQTYGLNQ